MLIVIGLTISEPFRACGRGPTLPLLFNLVADALSSLLDKAVNKGLIMGVLADLISGGISHIQYADDTVIMIDCSESQS